MEIVNKETGSIPLQIAFFLGAFALGTSENVIAGMLPQLSASLGISIAQTGLLITAYAGTAVVAGPLLAILTSTMRPFGLTAMAVALYTVGSLLAAFAPTFNILMVARILTGTMHTTILVMFILAAMETAAPDRKARTIGRITLGLGVATVLGVPIGTTLAQAFGWRASFLAISMLIAGTLALILYAFPRLGAPKSIGFGALRVLLRPDVSGGIAMSALAALGALTLLAFIVPMLAEAGVAADWLALSLFVYGAACLVGNQLGAIIADRNLPRSMVVTLAATCAALFVTTFSIHSAWVAVAAVSLVGLAYFSTFPPLNTWVATASSDLAPALALSLNSSAFNLGIAAAGIIGGSALQSGLPVSWLSLLGMLPVLFAVIVAFWLCQRRNGEVIIG
ncbi:MFS transporter [Chania multitudinisentens]|uniref:MFS transporter n=1 Tax=Chania multitudinisentens TaxID=1639108 RepID=UPI0003E13AD0|nr:MFS transporter [Chania multitudinisentens]